jgi:hypothetical protein
MLNIWTQPSGYTLPGISGITGDLTLDVARTTFDSRTTSFDKGTFQERVIVNIPLPILPQFGIPTPPPYDGSGHHPTAPLRNAAGSIFARAETNSYADGIYAMRTDLPNPRTISNNIVWDRVNEGEEFDPTGYSGYMYAFGQFLTHDLEFAREGYTFIPVTIPPGDENLTPGSFIPVTRNQLAPGTGINKIVGRTINDVTGWIDLSVVYGVAYPPGVPQGITLFQNPVNLREGGRVATTGKLLTSQNGMYPPVDSQGNYILGDPRGNENPDLLSMQTLFLREHNKIVDYLKTLHPAWDGERLYQRARTIVIAEFQNIVYKEWLPKVVGEIPAYTGFKQGIDATTPIEFSAAALRFGHSIVSGAQDRIDEFGNITEALTLAEAFGLQGPNYERNGGADGFLRKLAADITNKLDVHIIEDLRNLLDAPPAALDLAATNIQRGRDLGLPLLNQMRNLLALSPYTKFSDITNDPVLATALEKTYGDVNKVELWVGGLAENRYSGAMVGQTFHKIILDQFVKIRDGDNLYWENQPWPIEERTWVQGVTLADIILRNTDTINLQKDVFVAVERADVLDPNFPVAVPRIFPTTISNPILPTFRIISGELPPGLRIEGTYIVGVPYGVVRSTTFTFCIRAQLGLEIADRTFNIVVNGGQLPVITTPPGLLAVGRHGQKFALGKSVINYKLEAFDPDGEALTYFIAAGDGSLPPGLSLSSSGILSGIVEPVQAIALQTSGNGTYDDVFYDTTYFDFGIRSSNGYDSYIFDTVDFDYSTPTKAPRALNQTYEFLISVSTGDVVVKRKFSIFVIGDDSFYADYTQLTNDSDLFTADITFLQEPIWLTSGNLGTCRADNYVTYQLEVLEIVDAYPVVFTLGATDAWKTNAVYRVDDAVTYNTRTYICTTAHKSGVTFIANNGATLYWRLAELPPGLTFNPVDNKVFIAGRIPFQPAVAKNYSFSVIATRSGGDTQPIFARRTFNLRVIGDIDNTIKWNTDSNLGTIPANFVSDLEISASTVLNSNLIYTITSGALPPGIELTTYGELVGKVNQYGTPNVARFTTIDDSALKLDAKFTTIDANHQYDILGTRGLILFDSANPRFSIDGGVTTFDRIYKFTVYVKDQYGLSDSVKDFVLTVSTPNQKLYSNLKVQPLLNVAQRTNFRKFISDTDIFTTSSVFRPGDPNFGVRKDLAMLIYAGIETSSAAKYLGAMGLNHKRKRFHVGGITKAAAIKNKNIIYEVVYLQIIDPLEPNAQAPSEFVVNNARDQLKLTSDISNAIWANPTDTASLNLAESWLDRPISGVTIDSTAYNISDNSPNKHYISSVSNWRKSIATVGETERNYLPLWMRSIQPGQKLELGYKLAVPLCYCLPGTADDIILNIKYSGFDFKTLDYTADRYIIDSVTGQSSDKYLVFNNHATTV